MNNISEYKFLYGKAQKFENTNTYIFENNSKQRLIVSEKFGKFINGSTSKYLLFQFIHDKEIINQYIDRKSEEYKKMTNIRTVVDDLEGDMVQCTQCNTIIHKSSITSPKNDSCIYCDRYACKKCKKILPLAELDNNRLCEKCRGTIDE